MDEKRVRIFMLKTFEQLQEGTYYNVISWQAALLIANGSAKIPGQPSEFKPRGPSEMKIVKKKQSG